MGCMYESSSPNVWDELSKWNPLSDLCIDMIGLEHSFGNTSAMLVHVAIRIYSVHSNMSNCMLLCFRLGRHCYRRYCRWDSGSRRWSLRSSCYCRCWRWGRGQRPAIYTSFCCHHCSKDWVRWRCQGECVISSLVDNIPENTVLVFPCTPSHW